MDVGGAIWCWPHAGLWTKSEINRSGLRTWNEAKCHPLVEYDCCDQQRSVGKNAHAAKAFTDVINAKQ